MLDFLQTSAYFGLAITIGIFWICYLFSRKIKLSFLNPIILSAAVIIALLVFLDIDYETYESSASFITKLLTPATICYAVPLYRQIQILKEHFAAIIISIACGSAASILCVFGFAKVFAFSSDVYVAMLPKSVTTAIGLSLSQEMGGLVPITIAAIMISGLFGGAAAVLICKLFHITDSIAMGLSIGTASHAVGTSKAVEIGEVQGAMSSLAIVVAGLLTVIFASIASGWIV